MGKGAKKFPFGVILGWAKNFTNFTWNALKGAGGVFTKTFNWVKGGFSVFQKGLAFIKDGLSKVWSIYKDYISPAINNIKTFLNTFKGYVDDWLNKLTGGLWSLYKDVTELWTEFRKKFTEITGRIQDLVSIFDRKLAERIDILSSKFVRYVDDRIYQLKDWVDRTIYRHIDEVMRRITALEIATERFFRPLKDTIDALDKLISISLEPDGTYKRKPFLETVKRNYDDLWSVLIDRTEEQLPPRPIELPEYREFLPLLEKEVNAFYQWSSPDYQDYFDVIDEEGEKLHEWKTAEREKKIEFDPEKASQDINKSIEEGHFLGPTVF